MWSYPRKFVFSNGQVQEKTLNKLVPLAEKAKFTSVLILLWERQGQLNLAFENFLSMKYDLNLLIFDWIEKIFTQLKESSATGNIASTLHFKDFENLLSMKLPELVLINNNRSYILMKKTLGDDDDSQKDLVKDVLGKNPKTQMKYLEAMAEE